MLGVPGRRVDRLLQIHAGVHVAQEELRDPLVLLVAAGRAPGEIGLAVAQRQRRRQRRARAFARRQRGRMVLIEPEHLRAGAEAKAELGDHRRGLQPAAGRRRRHHVAGAIDDVEMHGVAAHRAGALALRPSTDRALVFVVRPVDAPTVGSPAPGDAARAPGQAHVDAACRSPSIVPGRNSSEARSVTSLRRSAL